MSLISPPSGRSLWSDTMPPHERFDCQSSFSHPDSLRTGDLAQIAHADVVIVGAGYTGLWTALELLRRDPTCDVVILEREHVGFGASGRNGGWCSAILPMSLERVAASHGRGAATRLQAAMHDTVRTVTEFSREFARSQGGPEIVHDGGSIDVARNPAQRRRLQAHVEEMQRFGFGSADYRFVDADEAKTWCNATGVIGGAMTPHCAVAHPLRLVHALAHEVTKAGGRIVEGITVTDIESAAEHTSSSQNLRRPRVHFSVGGELGEGANNEAVVEADVVVQATEAYSCQLPGQHRDLLPIYSMMIATEPLSDEMWASIGLQNRPTFADGRNLIIYGQRTADGRLAFGGRGAPYHFASRINPRFDTDPNIAALLHESLIEMFPVLSEAAITNHWGGVLAAPRDWTCSVRFDRKRGIASAGGYVGDGVATAALAGAALAELINPGDRPDLTQLAIVGHQSRRWETEPLRWLGVNTARLAARRADAAEQQQRRSARLWSGLTESLLRR